MAKTALVTVDYTTGLEMVRALDRADLSIKVAMWIVTDEYEDWRFLLASPRLDSAKGAQKYGLVLDALQTAGIPSQLTPSLMIREMSHPLIRELRKMFAKSTVVEGMHTGGYSLGGRFVEDAVVYRIR